MLKKFIQQLYDNKIESYYQNMVAGDADDFKNSIEGLLFETSDSWIPRNKLHTLRAIRRHENGQFILQYLREVQDIHKQEQTRETMHYDFPPQCTEDIYTVIVNN